MSKRTELLLNEKDNDDGIVLSKFVIQITDKGKVNTSLEPGDLKQDEMTEEQLEQSAKGVISFLAKDLLARAVRWNIDLGANKRVVKHMLADRIQDASKMLLMDDKSWDEIYLGCNKNPKE